MTVQIPSVNQTLTPDQAGQALSFAYQVVTRTVPSVNVLALMMAHTAFETGNWQKMPDYNFGGIKAASTDAFSQSFTSTEGYGSSTQTLAEQFAAYLSADDGAQGYVTIMKNHSNWWNGLQSGTPQGLLTGLTSAPAYFTGDPSTYLSNVTSLFTEYTPIAQKYASSFLLWPSTLVPVAIVGGLGALAWTIHTGALRRFARRYRVPLLEAFA